MKRKKMSGNIVYIVFLCISICISLLYIYFLINNYYKGYLTIFDYDAYKKYIEWQNSDFYFCVSKFLSFNTYLSIILVPLFIITLYKTLKFFEILKRKKRYPIFYLLSVIFFIYLLAYKIISMDEIVTKFEGYFSILGKYYYNFYFIIIVPCLVITSKYAINYHLLISNPNYERYFKDREKEKKKKKIIEELDSLRSYQKSLCAKEGDEH